MTVRSVMSGKSSILYQNPQQSLFLVDIPASIELAQFPSLKCQNDVATTIAAVPSCCNRRLLSSKPLEKPYPCPPEPKSQAARARLLTRIPESEILFQNNIAPFVQNGVDEIKKAFRGGKWCKPRQTPFIEEREDNDNKHVGIVGINPRALYADRKLLEPSRKKMKLLSIMNGDKDSKYVGNTEKQPPLILSSSSVNEFSNLSDLRGFHVKNPSNTESATIGFAGSDTGIFTTHTIPPRSNFVLDNLSASKPPIPGLPSSEKFNIILFDPPWPNRSVRRSSQYPTHEYLEMDALVTIMQQTILAHLDSNGNSQESLVGIWTTNNAKTRQAAQTSFERTGMQLSEIWIWVKTTENGELVSPLDGLWRKPYEVLFLGRRLKNNMRKAVSKDEYQEPTKRIVAAVPDEHSRKPNLKELVESLFFHAEELEEHAETKSYTALEVFARNLTAGWSACGNDVLKYNANTWWVPS